MEELKRQMEEMKKHNEELQRRLDESKHDSPPAQADTSGYESDSESEVEAKQPRKKQGLRRKNWCFTGWLHKGCPSFETMWKKWGPDGDNFLQRLYGQPELTAGGRKHLQGYFQCTTVQRITAVLKRFPGGQFHIEMMNGTPDESEKYCSKDASKDGEVFAQGIKTRQGKLKTWERVQDALKDGATNRQMWNSPLFGAMLNHHKAVDVARINLADQHEPASFELATFPWEPIDFDSSKVWVLSGKPGIGKTEFALAHSGRWLLVSELEDLARFDQNEHEGIIFDDFGHHMRKLDREKLINILDSNHSRSVRILYQSIRLPKGIKKIFTTNALGEFGVRGDMGGDHGSLTRRYSIRYLDGTHKDTPWNEDETTENLDSADEQPGQLVRSQARVWTQLSSRPEEQSDDEMEDAMNDAADVIYNPEEINRRLMEE